jgi:hypothetical protein
MPLQVAFSIQGVGGWLDLEDPQNGYEAHKDARAQQAVSWRKQEITSAYVEGAFITEAVREMVVEPLVIYVHGATIYQLDQRVTALTSGAEPAAVPGQGPAGQPTRDLALHGGRLHRGDHPGVPALHDGRRPGPGPRQPSVTKAVVP